MLDVEMAKSFNSVVEEIDGCVKKLEKWYGYYADEGVTFNSGALKEGYSTLMEGIKENISSVKHNVVGLNMACALLGLYGLASITDENHH